MSCKYLLLFLLGLFAASLAVNEKDLKVIRFPFTLAKGEAGREGIESASPFHEAKTVFKNGETFTTSTYHYPTVQELSQYYAKPGSKTNRDLKNWVPEYKGSVIPVKKNNGNTYSGSLTWNGRCFRNNTATIELDVTRQIASLVIDSSNASTYLCADWYFIVTRESYHVKGVFLRGKHHITITKFKEGEIQDILDNGFRVFLFIDGFVGTLIDVYHSYKVLYGTLYLEDKIKFFKENMNISFVERPYRKYYLDPKEIRSGDIFIKDTMSGADGLIMYGTGGRAGHMFAGLWFGDELYIVESTDVGVQKTKYADWWAIQDPETMIVIHAHLKPEYQKNFDEQKAIEFFKSVEGMPYGYSNFAYGWVDTLQDNYPAPLDQHMVPATMVLGEALAPKVIYIGFLEGLNQRLRYYFNETEANCQSTSCVFGYLDKHNASLAEVMTLVEKDEWTYPQGKQMVCSAFLIALYKHAGIFDSELAETLEATEFTPKDVYQLNIWEVPKEIPEEAKVPGYDYLQIVGKWYWELPGYNTVSMYKHMNEKCGAIPPEYKRFPDEC